MTRRAWMGVMAVAGARGAEPGIRTVGVYPVKYPVVGKFKFFPKPERVAVLVRVTLEDGTEGWGQSVPIPTWSYETLESVTSALRLYLGPAAVGAADLAGLHQRMNRAIAPSFSTGMPIAKAGLDLALHDALGKRQGKPVAAMWGRKAGGSIRLSWTVNTTSLEEAEQQVAAGKARGYENFNIKVAPDVEFDVELAKLVRRLAPKTFLWADANGGYDAETALRAAPRLKDAGVDVLEQPVAANRLSGFAALKRQGALPVILDEGVVSVADLEEFIQLNLLDGVALKPARTAGLWDAWKQVRLLEQRGMMILGSGLTDPDVSLAASLQLYAAAGLKYPAALNGPQFLGSSLLKKPLAPEGGRLAVPVEPGLGIELDEEKLAKAVVNV